MKLLDALARALLVFGLCCCAALAGAAAVPPISAHVTDLTGTLSAAQRAALEQRLGDFGREKGSQLAVLIVPSTAPESIDEYSLRVAEQWQLGRRKVDDGALLLIAKDDRTLRIEVGYGLEGALNDAVSQRIISEIITPHFQQGDFYGGVAAGVDAMMAVVRNEPLPMPTDDTWSGPDHGLDYLAPLLILALALGGVLRALLGRMPGALLTSAVMGAAGWLLLATLPAALMLALAGLLCTWFGGGLWAIRYGLGGGRGGGGGGFSGGGGGFGGGGASGRW